MHCSMILNQIYFNFNHKMSYIMAKVFIPNIFKREENRKGIRRLKDVY